MNYPDCGCQRQLVRNRDFSSTRGSLLSLGEYPGGLTSHNYNVFANPHRSTILLFLFNIKMFTPNSL